MSCRRRGDPTLDCVLRLMSLRGKKQKKKTVAVFPSTRRLLESLLIVRLPDQENGQELSWLQALWVTTHSMNGYLELQVSPTGLGKRCIYI